MLAIAALLSGWPLMVASTRTEPALKSNDIMSSVMPRKVDTMLAFTALLNESRRRESNESRAKSMPSRVICTLEVALSKDVGVGVGMGVGTGPDACVGTAPGIGVGRDVGMGPGAGVGAAPGVELGTEAT